MKIHKNPNNETELREYIKELTLDDIALEEDLSINFIREFHHKINWKYVFDTKYLYYQYDIVIGNEGVNWKDHIEPKSFEEWMKENYMKIWNEYYNR